MCVCTLLLFSQKVLAAVATIYYLNVRYNLLVKIS